MLLATAFYVVGLYHVLLTSYPVRAVEPGGTPESGDIPLRFLTEPESVIVWPNFNSTIRLYCIVEPMNAEIRWTVNGSDNLSGHTIEAESIRLPVGIADPEAGVLRNGDLVYRCSATSAAGTIISREAVVSLTRLEPFADDLLSQDMTVLDGSTTMITCTAPSGNPPPVVEFERNGRRFRLGERFKILPSGNLQIIRVNRKDEGVYRCSAINPVNLERREAPYTSNLRVNATLPSPRQSAPTILSNPLTSVAAKVGSNVTLECAADGVPAPTIVWTRHDDDSPLTVGGRYSTIFGNLIIADVQENDEGLYKCLASNTMGSQSASTMLIVHVPPAITRPPGSQTVIEDSSVDFDCDVRGNPTPSVRWFHNGVSVVDSSGTTLRLSSVKLEDSGMYQCFATNVIGVESASARLTVLEKPPLQESTPVVLPLNRAPGDEPTRQAAAFITQKPRGRTKSSTSTSTTFVIAVDDEVETTQYPTVMLFNDSSASTETRLEPQVVGKGKAGSSQKLQLVAPTVSQQSEKSVLVQWTNVMMNNSIEVEFYKLQYQEMSSGAGGNRKWETVDDDILPTSRQFEVTNLKPGATYRFRLAAALSNDDNLVGQVSNRLTLETTSVQGRQRRPTGTVIVVELRPSGNGSMAIKWQYDNNDRAPVDGFRILYKPYSDNEVTDEYQIFTVNGSKVRRAEISDLRSDTSYSFRMQSFNGAGRGELSNTYVKKTLGGLGESVDVEPFTLVAPASTTSRRSEGVYVPNRMSTHASNELLFVLLGIVLSSTVVTLIGIMCACACQQRRRNRMLAARRGETKFHDPSRSIYLNTLKSMNGGNSGGFLLKNIDNGPGNRLAVNGGRQDSRHSGRWSSVIDGRPPSELKQEVVENMQCLEQPPMTSEAKANDYLLEKSTGDTTDLTSDEFGDVNGDIMATIAPDEMSDLGLIQRPRDMAPSTSSSSQHLTSSRSATRGAAVGGGCSEAGSRQSSSLNRDRRTSPDHIPRLHECWSLEPVRRANNRGTGSRGATEPSSDLSSLDSLPAYSNQRHASSGVCHELGERDQTHSDIKSKAERVERANFSMPFVLADGFLVAMEADTGGDKC